MRKAFAVLILAAFAGVLAAQESRTRFPPPIDEGEATINAGDIRKNVDWLASDDLKGRRTGSEDEKTAGDWIIKHFEACGIKPAGEGKVWTQKFRAMTFTGNNVLGVMAGSSEVKSGEYVVVGAHYDHVGLGTFGSRTSASGQIHHGADDNASGTAALLELAQAFAKKHTKRSLLFFAFSGEEMGLLGSHAWCEKPSRSLGKIVAMVNLDMVGRCREDYVFVGGTGTGKGFPDLVRKEAAKFPFKVEMGPGGTGPSDFESFYRKQVPVLQFFTGLHEEYHTPADVASLINVDDEAGIVKLVYRVVRRLGDDDRRPEFEKDDRASLPESLLTQFHYADQMQGPRLGMRIGDATAQGAPVTEVEPKSPAGEAGVKEGDLVVSVNGIKPQHQFDLLSILGTVPEKTAATLVILREGKMISKSVMLK